jgi:hypothetical protein
VVSRLSCTLGRARISSSKIRPPLPWRRRHKSHDRTVRSATKLLKGHISITALLDIITVFEQDSGKARGEMVLAQPANR